MNKRFIIEMCSDVEYEGMVIDIRFDNNAVARLNYEKGKDNIEIVLESHDVELIFPLEDFLIALEKAKNLAIQCAEEDENMRKG